MLSLLDDVPFYLSRRELESYRAADDRDYRRMLRETRASDDARRNPYWANYTGRHDSMAFGEGRT